MTSPQTVTQGRDFSAYREFTGKLRTLAAARPNDEKWSKQVDSCLDGVAGAELRRLVQLPVRRAAGAFFTGSKLAGRLVGKLPLNPHRHFIYDPAVGAGDLLLSACRNRLSRGWRKVEGWHKLYVQCLECCHSYYQW